MATSKLPGVPPSSELPKAKNSERDAVYNDMLDFVGLERWGWMGVRDEQGVPKVDETLSLSEGFKKVGIVETLKRIKNIPQWEKGLASKKALKAEWDSYFALFPKWIDNIFERLNEKNNTFTSDDDATDESREIEWMKGRIAKLQTDIDFAAQEAITAKPPSWSSPSPEPAAPSPAPSSGPAAPSAGPAAPSSAAQSSAPAAEPEAAKKAPKKDKTNWMLYAAGGAVLLVLLGQMNRR